MKLLFNLLISYFLLLSSYCFSQGITLGQWRDHLPYNNCVAVANTGNKIYCATKYCLFSYDKTDNSISRINKINGLSDFGVSTIKYDYKYHVLLVAYTNTNLDVIDDKGVITNISDIKRKQILGSKTINNITFIGNYAYLACSFGIIVLDVAKLEIRDTYFIGPQGTAINVNDITSDGEKLYAATKSGIYVASLSSANLADYSSWAKIKTLPYPNNNYNHIIYFNNKVIVNQSNTAYSSDSIYEYDGNNWNIFNHYAKEIINNFEISNNQLIISANGFVDVIGTDNEVKIHVYNYITHDWIVPMDAITDSQNNVWIADQSLGLVKWNASGAQIILPNGPATNNVFSMAYNGNYLWATTGSLDATWNNLYTNNGVYLYDYNKAQWRSFTKTNTSAMNDIFDYISVGIDPNNPENAYIGTWSKGMMLFKNEQYSQFYNAANSSIRPYQPYGPTSSYSVLRVGGICFDADDNMWVTNPGADNPISVKMTGDNGSWFSFHFPKIANSNSLGNIIIDNSNQKWAILPRGGGILVFNDNYTIADKSDDQYKILTNVPGNGNLPSSNVLSIANDLNGEIWIGTDQGVAVIYSPGDVFLANDWDAQQILLQQNGHWQYLLSTESVTAIAVDGANRKWLGTISSGVYLMSADGNTLIHNFNVDNSPLLSNTITSIAINNQTGEVFFGTNNGIISFKSDATGGKDAFGDKNSVYAYPNPVKHGYNGPIAIKGLVTNADVRITGISGNLVYSTTALGGQAIWYGKNFDGEQVNTGVYLVFCTNDDGSQKLVSKILVIK